MADDRARWTTPLVERPVLPELAERDRLDRTPADATGLPGRFRDRAGALDDVGGRPPEADLAGTCGDLRRAGLATGHPHGPTSPTGRGRPAFGPAVDPGAVRDVVRGDDRFGGLPGVDGTR